MSLLFLALLLQETGTSPCRPLKPDGELAALLKEYSFEDKEFRWQLRKVRGTRIVQYELSFASALAVDPEPNHTVWAKYWAPAEGGPYPAMILIHWLGGSFDALDLVAYRMAEQGVCALAITLPHYGKRNVKGESMLTLSMEKTLRNFRQAVLDVRRSSDWLASRREVDPRRIGVLGISLGAIVASLTAGVDGGFAAVVLVIGGGDLPSIVFHESPETKEIREELQKYGLTQEKVAEYWKPIEPLTFAKRVSTDTVLMFNAESDEIIPRVSTERLHEALGKPKIEWFKGGHYAAVTQLGGVLKKTVEFLRETPRVRVLLAESQPSFAVEVRSSWIAFKAGTDEEVARGEACRMDVAMKGRVSLGDHAGPVLLVPRTSGSLRIAKLDFHGSLLFTPNGHVLNIVDLERYVMGVLGPEIGKNAPPEAQKAQAVAARTYAYFLLLERKAEAFDVYADVRDQVYRGVPKDDVYIRATDETRGEILFFQGTPLKAYFHSTCGGRTESVFEWRKEKEIAPFAGVTCGFCDNAKWATWTARVTTAEVEKAFKLKGVTGVAVKSTTKCGRAREVSIRCSTGDVVVAGPEFRASIGYDRFRSTWFTVKKDGDDYRFTGRGWGHGVGMCQEGAIGMAAAGRGYREILKTYYPETTLERR